MTHIPPHRMREETARRRAAERAAERYLMLMGIFSMALPPEARSQINNLAIAEAAATDSDLDFGERLFQIKQIVKSCRIEG